MCDRPYLIDNPHYGLKNVGHNYLYDTIHTKIPVPCGHCPTCIALRQSYFIQRCQMEALDNDLFFCTLTYQRSMIRSLDVNGFKLKYADWSDLQKMLKRIRKSKLFGDSFRYFAVSEYGGETNRPHFHIFFSIPKIKDETFGELMYRENLYYKAVFKEWSRNVGSNRKPIYKPCSKLVVTSKGRTYDFHYVNPSLTDNAEADVGFYITKYVLKASPYVEKLHSALKLNLDLEEFEQVWRLLKPRCCCSKDWGNSKSQSVKSYIRKCIDFSIDKTNLEYPVFINPISGQEFPLSPFYKRKFMNITDAHSFYFRSSDDKYFTDDYSVSDVDRIDNRFYTIHRKLSLDSISSNFLDID